MTAPIPTDVMILESSRNSSALLTGNLYLQGSKVGLSKCLRRFSAVWIWMSSCYKGRVSCKVPERERENMSEKLTACTLVTTSMVKSKS